MNAPSRLSLPARILLWCGAIMAFCLLVVALAAWSILTPSREVARVREVLRRGEPLATRVQLDLGSVSTFLIRNGVLLAPDLPEEARCAVRSLRRASVGVYELERASEGAGGDDTQVADEPWTALEPEMARSGYSRIVAVRGEAGERVAVWVAADEDTRLRLCVGVRDHSDLVVVSAELEAAELAALVRLDRIPALMEGAGKADGEGHAGEAAASPQASTSEKF